MDIYQRVHIYIQNKCQCISSRAWNMLHIDNFTLAYTCLFIAALPLLWILKEELLLWEILIFLMILLRQGFTFLVIRRVHQADTDDLCQLEHGLCTQMGRVALDTAVLLALIIAFFVVFVIMVDMAHHIPTLFMLYIALCTAFNFPYIGLVFALSDPTKNQDLEVAYQ